MSCVNKIILMGPCIGFKETKTKSGLPVVLFSLKTWIKVPDGEKKTYHPIAAYGGLADLIARTCKDGITLYVEGRVERYKDSQGVYQSQVVAEEFKFVTPLSDS